MRRSMPSVLLSCAARFGLAFAAAIGAGVAQTNVPTRPTVPPDPYTRGDAAALAKVGYAAIGPFPFGHRHGTREIDELLGSEPLVWIETAHFRLGSALPALPMRAIGDGGGEWVDRTRAELKVLAKVLPRLRPDTKDLDPWLRAHLYASRLEQLYAEVQSVLGVTDADFTPAADDPNQPASFRGLGPYLGMREKFTVLLLQRGSSHARYTAAHHHQEFTDPIRLHDATFGSMYWGASLETAEGLFTNDFALHTHLVFNVSHNLYSCYRSYSHDLPAWLATGLGHWHARRICPRFPTYDRKHERDREPRTAFWEWDKRVPGMMKNGIFEPLEVFLARNTAGEFGIEQHIQAWALVDHLMAKHRAELGKFLRTLKDPFHGRRSMPSSTELQERQVAALQSSLAMTPAVLEQQWRATVLRAKAKK
jgi:hypothetical protein